MYESSLLTWSLLVVQSPSWADLVAATRWMRASPIAKSSTLTRRSRDTTQLVAEKQPWAIPASCAAARPRPASANSAMMWRGSSAPASSSVVPLTNS